MGVRLEKISKYEYKILEDIKVSTKYYNITVKKHITTDGASIPRALWSIVGSPFTGNYTEAALVHDALYMSESLSRSECDKVFLELMTQAGVSWFKRTIMYSAVRLAGWTVWNEHFESMVLYNKQFVKITIKKEEN